MSLEMQVSVCIVALGILICCLTYEFFRRLAARAAEKHMPVERTETRVELAFELKGKGWGRQAGTVITGISLRPDGVHELSPHKYVKTSELQNVTVEILECENCGDVSVGWKMQENTIRR